MTVSTSFMTWIIMVVLFFASLLILTVGVILIRKGKAELFASLLSALGGLGILCMLIAPFLVISNLKSEKAAAVSLVGGANGPTSVFLAGKIGGPNPIVIVIGVIIWILAGLFIYHCVSKKHME
ncbi:MAG: hypothetical protein PHC41_15810 [Lachnospiraceae bacterium]|nr:hypothetical protein [Lachnospiraceae bacterium]MDD3617656.1 hypothetical protein [Lachnospiraceae bacterium]